MVRSLLPIPILSVAYIVGDGVDDYIFIDQSGVLKVYVNGGPATDGSNGWVWAPQGKDGIINNGAGASRDQVHLADINGERCSLVFDDPAK